MRFSTPLCVFALVMGLMSLLASGCSFEDCLEDQGCGEINKVDLAGLALELALWGVADPAELPFLDEPPAKTFAAGRGLLQLLGALDESGRLTETGRAMATLPLHPRLARMVIDAGTDQELAGIVAALVDDRDVLRGHPDDVPQKRPVPGLAGCSYFFHGRGCCITTADGEEIDVDFDEHGGDAIDHQTLAGDR